MDYWQDKVAIVTGGSSGLGLALSKSLLDHGARVLIAARDRERLQSAVAMLRASPSNVEVVATDVTRDDDVRALVSQATATHGRIHALLHCVGVSDRGEACPPRAPSG